MELLCVLCTGKGVGRKKRCPTDGVCSFFFTVVPLKTVGFKVGSLDERRIYPHTLPLLQKVFRRILFMSWVREKVVEGGLGFPGCAMDVCMIVGLCCMMGWDIYKLNEA